MSKQTFGWWFQESFLRVRVIFFSDIFNKNEAFINFSKIEQRFFSWFVKIVFYMFWRTVSARFLKKRNFYKFFTRWKKKFLLLLTKIISTVQKIILSDSFEEYSQIQKINRTSSNFSWHVCQNCIWRSKELFWEYDLRKVQIDKIYPNLKGKYSLVFLKIVSSCPEGHF